MKILLVGEFSGLNAGLKDGLQALGHQVTLAAGGDGFKKIPGADKRLYPNAHGKSLFHKIYSYVYYPLTDNSLKGYDVVQVVGTDIFYRPIGALPYMRLKNNNDRFFINAAGVDYYLYQYWKNKKYAYEYYMFDDNPQLCALYDGKSINSRQINHTCKKVNEIADGIIPVIPYEYEAPYRTFNNLRKPILFPINIDSIIYKENQVKDKIVFFHGISRPLDKGSNYIKEAMKIIQEKYPSDVECIVVERLPYEEDVRVMSRANVIIDQCKSFGYGINASIAMAQGKVVMSGAEKLDIESVKGSCPVINIRPSVHQIVSEMERLIENKNEIQDMGRRSREYVEENHNYIKIAQQYIETWSA